jgi:ankyrin repeat protein
MLRHAFFFLCRTSLFTGRRVPLGFVLVLITLCLGKIALGIEGGKKTISSADNENLSGKSESITATIEADNPETLKKLIQEMPVGLRSKGKRDALFAAAAAGKLAILNWLIQEHVEINARDDDQMTPLMWAAREARPEVFALLLGSKANLSLKDANGLTAVSYCVMGGNIQSLQDLLNPGVDVNHREGKLGMTTLMFAAKCGELKNRQIP